MTDIKCPMCSKPNPADAQVCQFCGARITPLGSIPPEAPDWLSGLRPDESPTQSVEAAATPEGDVPDWLARIREKSQLDQQDESAETPDWLSELGAAPSAEPEADTDWLSSLRSQESPLPGEAQGGEIAPGDIPDWLSAAQPPAAPATQPEAIPDVEGLKDSQTWQDQPTLSIHPPQNIEASQEATAEEELPDWLNGSANLQAAPQIPTDLQAETPDWLAGLGQAEPETAPAAEPGETPDWLAGLGQAEPETTPAAEPGETPDWLAGLGQAEPEAAPAAEPAAEAKETPDWLSGLPSQEAEESSAIPAFGEDLPAWLSKMPSEEPPEMPPDSAGGTPDWLSALPVEETQGLPKSPSGEGAPEWLKAFEQPGTTPPQDQPVSAFPAEDVAEWLAPEGAETSGTTSPFVGAAGLGTDWEGQETGERKESTPAFSFDLPPTSQSPEREETPFSEEEILASAVAESLKPAGGAVFEAAPEGLMPAELPSWVAAMRPVESVAPLASPLPDDQHIENLGPLAGLRGTLLGNESVTQYTTPATYSAKLQVSDRQHLHSNLLEEMLKEETQPRSVSHELTSKSSRWFRLITALILIGALLIPLLFGGANPIPAGLTIPTSPAAQLYMEIVSLSQKPVLIIVDYEPGMAAELQFTAVGFVQHLMEKTIPIVLISSTQSGPLLAENLLKEAGKGQSAYPVDELSVNLGYIPGGTTGLLSAASDLRATLRQPLRGSWDNPALLGMNRPGDFQHVFLLTGSDDSARAWIEQLQPLLGNTPLRVLSSAQAAPMLQPYVESGQVRSLLSGLMGGAAYQQLRQSDYPGNSSWLAYFNAYQTGIAVAIAMIAVGLLLQLFLSLLNSTKKRKGA